MEINRRQLLTGTVLAAIPTTGCLQENRIGVENHRDDATTPVPEDPRVDEPPYEIEEQPDDEEAWNQLYLCEHMSAASDLEFEAVSAPQLTDPLLSIHDRDGEEYAVRVLDSPADVRELFEVGGTEDEGDADESEKPIDAIDFEKYVLLVVESGYGSGSIAHHWKRVEATGRGFRLHGCYTKPYLRTADISPRHSVVRVERPDDFAFARVSLTVGQERRIHFNSTEGVVSVDPPE